MRFNTFLFAALVSTAGDWLTTVAVGVLVYEISGSAAAPAVFVLVRTLPRLFGTLVGGALADRFAANRGLAAVYGAQAVVAVGLYLAASHRSVAALYVGVAVSQLIGSAQRPMQQAILPALVRRDGIQQASSIFGTGMGAMVFIAPAIGVILFRAHGAALPIAIDAASFAVAAALLLGLGRTGDAREHVARSAWRTAAAGLAPLLGDPILRTLVGTYVGTALLTGAVQGSIVVIAGDRFGGPELSGLLYAALGAGAIVGGTTVTLHPARRVSRGLLLGAGMVTMVPLAGLAATRSLWQALVLMALSAAGSVAIDAWGPAEIAYRVDRRLLGRANAAMVLCGFVGVLAGAVIAVVFVPTVGWPATVLATAAVAITFSFLIATSSHPSPAPAASATYG